MKWIIVLAALTLSLPGCIDSGASDLQLLTLEVVPQDAPRYAGDPVVFWVNRTNPTDEVQDGRFCAKINDVLQQCGDFVLVPGEKRSSRMQGQLTKEGVNIIEAGVVGRPSLSLTVFAEDAANKPPPEP